MKKNTFWLAVFSKHTLITVLATLVVITAGRFALHSIMWKKFDSMTVEQRAEKVTNRMAKKLALSDDEKSKVKTTLVSNLTAMKANRDNQFQKLDADMKKALSSDHYNKWQQNFEKRKHHMMF